jgi:hypothetical protein
VGVSFCSHAFRLNQENFRISFIFADIKRVIFKTNINIKYIYEIRVQFNNLFDCSLLQFNDYLEAGYITFQYGLFNYSFEHFYGKRDI